jgi:hypothetical protein
MQGAARLIMGKFFYASINVGDGAPRIDIFVNEQGFGEDYIEKEIRPQLTKIIARFHQWILNDKALQGDKKKAK